jgi:hypothetical protein
MCQGSANVARGRHVGDGSYHRARGQTGACDPLRIESSMVAVTYGIAGKPRRLRRAARLACRLAGPFMASGDDHLGGFVDSMGALPVGSHTYAESEQTLAWFGRGLGISTPIHVFTSRRLPISGPTITLTDASVRRRSVTGLTRRHARMVQESPVYTAERPWRRV